MSCPIKTMILGRIEPNLNPQGVNLVMSSESAKVLAEAFALDIKNFNSGNFFEQYGSLIASVIALIIAGGAGQRLKSMVYKPKLKITGLRGFSQSHELTVWRLAIKNFGNKTAKNVQVDVVEITDNKKKRKNFLPVPLKWTHLNKESRNILPKQTVYLDLFDQISKGPLSDIDFRIRIGSRFGTGISDFTEIIVGKSVLKLNSFQANGNVLSAQIITEWGGSFIFKPKLKLQ